MSVCSVFPRRAVFQSATPADRTSHRPCDLALVDLLLLWLCFEGKFSAVAGLVHAFDSLQSCV